MERKLGILLVEDDRRHMEDATTEMDRRIRAGAPIDLMYATNTEEGVGVIRENRLDGVISDVFMPLGRQPDNLERQRLYGLVEPFAGGWRNIERAREAVEEWLKGREAAPFGLRVYNFAKSRGIPFTFCTAGHHHGDKYESIQAFCGEENVWLTDTEHENLPPHPNPLEAGRHSKDVNAEAAAKPWGRAYNELMIEMARRQDSVPLPCRDWYFADESRAQKFEIKDRLAEWRRIARDYGVDGRYLIE